jgi:hypothetical protein
VRVQRRADAGADPALDLHKGIADPAAGGCARWPEHLRLKSSSGELVRGRCRATNQCAYCARLFAVETSEMLLLDAMEHAPTLLVVLTARELLERADCRAHLQQLHRSLRRRWPGIEWAVLVEFQRRGALHLNLLVKGVPADQADELHAAACAIWCQRVDAVPAAQSVTPIYAVGGAVKYVSQHFMKPDQAPPEGWRGHRYSATRGYLVRPAAELRQEARAALRRKRAIWKLDQASGGVLTAQELEEFADRELELAAGVTWELVRLYALARDEHGHSARRPLVAAVRASRHGGTAAPTNRRDARRTTDAPAEAEARNGRRAPVAPRASAEVPVRTPNGEADAADAPRRPAHDPPSCLAAERAPP